ncbi:DUF3048 domain-containing protein [Gandjariella thermophila]|uniref:DUF3048 domain-containing protein n=1 Tax=Gandjariella thermophila TaxID=1931992 RepID=A0A4D4J2S0_9PSEU|nr:DUF3048 domain-containing protein [Gandjariella thermophila]GDY29714.1 hypothetical protein GTS_13470 [Gandjariella thermophila]
MRRRRTVVALAAVAAVAVAGTVTAVLLSRHPHAAPPPPPLPLTTTGTPTTTPPPPPPAQPPVRVIKIDNVAPARPHTGLAGADVIYVEPVEGGLTRIAAVFGTRLPPVVGPVRSARESDLELLPEYGRPTLGYSGAAPPLLPMIQAASVVNASPAQVPNAYFRDNRRPTPHNLYVHPADLPLGTGAPRQVLQFGPAPPGGVPTADQHVQYQAASYDFHWAPPGQWLVTMDGSPFVSTEAGRLAASTVVIQRVATHNSPYVEDALGNVSPVAQTVGQGAATVLRDGQAFPATWSRPGPQDPTSYTTPGGQPLPLAPGQVWILLVPA